MSSKSFVSLCFPLQYKHTHTHTTDIYIYIYEYEYVKERKLGVLYSASFCKETTKKERLAGKSQIVQKEGIQYIFTTLHYQ